MDEKDEKRILEETRKMTKALMDRGFIIEAGWVGYMIMAVKADRPRIIEEAKFAFFAGAYHLFTSIMSTLDPGQEATERDLKRLDLINDELKKFAVELEKRYDKIMREIH